MVGHRKATLDDMAHHVSTPLQDMESNSDMGDLNDEIQNSDISIQIDTPVYTVSEGAEGRFSFVNVTGTQTQASVVATTVLAPSTTGNGTGAAHVWPTNGNYNNSHSNYCT